MIEIYFTQHLIYLILNCTVILDTRLENQIKFYVFSTLNNFRKDLNFWLTCILLYAVRSSYKTEHGRGPGKQSSLCSQVPERQSLVASGGHEGRCHPGSGLCQAGGEERERRGGAFPEVPRRHRAKGEGGSQWQV